MALAIFDRGSDNHNQQHIVEEHPLLPVKEVSVCTCIFYTICHPKKHPNPTHDMQPTWPCSKSTHDNAKQRRTNDHRPAVAEREKGVSLGPIFAVGGAPRMTQTVICTNVHRLTRKRHPQQLPQWDNVSGHIEQYVHVQTLKANKDTQIHRHRHRHTHTHRCAYWHTCLLP